MKSHFDPSFVEGKRKESFESETSSTFGTNSYSTRSPASDASAGVHNNVIISTTSPSPVTNDYNGVIEDSIESLTTGTNIFILSKQIFLIIYSKILAVKYLKKASKLLTNKSRSPWLSWLKGYDKKSCKYLNIFKQVIPKLQDRCIEISNKLECTELDIRRSQATLLHYLVLLRLSCCLYNSKSFLYEDILDECKKLSVRMGGEMKQIKAGQMFNKELLVFVEAETKRCKSRQSTLEPQYTFATRNEGEVHCFKEEKGDDVISIGKSRRHEHQPAVWVGQLTSNNALPVTITSPPSPSERKIKRAKSINKELYNLENLERSLAVDDYNIFVDSKVDYMDNFMQEVEEYKRNIICRCTKDRMKQKRIKAKFNEIKTFLDPNIFEKTLDVLMRCNCMHEFHDMIKSEALTNAMACMPSDISGADIAVQYYFWILKCYTEYTRV